MNWHKQKLVQQFIHSSRKKSHIVRSQAENWGKNRLYHLLNIMSLQIGQYEGLIFDPASAQLSPSLNVLTIVINTTNNVQYIINGRQTGDKLDVVIRTDYDQFVGSYSYYFSRNQPYDVATSILTNIYNHINMNLT
jgi:hypothetical protein